MTTNLVDQQLQTFAQRFGQPHVDLACHAAVPAALTPDLLYRLWAYFRCDVQGQSLHIPWVAVADVLLAPFCRDKGYDLYEIETEVRSTLLDQLKQDPRFGEVRIQEVSKFLLAYHPSTQLDSDDPDLQELAQVQRWGALAQTQPHLVVRDLARTLVQTPDSEAEWSRVAALMARLQVSREEEGQVLWQYVQGRAALAQGKLQQSLADFSQLPGQGRYDIKVAGVALPVPETIRQQTMFVPKMTRRRCLQGAAWGTAGAVGAVLISLTLTSEETAEETAALQRQNIVFPVEVVRLNAQGDEVERQAIQMGSTRWSQGNEFALEVVDIPSGEFEMGSPSDEIGRNNDEGPQHWVRATAFSMGRYQVTQAQWRFAARLERVNRRLVSEPSRFQGDDRPVETVSWEDAVEFCDRISRHLGVTCRLPSEAEWEYACRAGTPTPFHFGETIMSEVSNYDGTETYAEEPAGVSLRATTPVGSFGVANAFGLYDMHGNVWEWCQDVWHNSYEGAPTDGSAWLEGGNQSRRLLRGGCWYSNPRLCRSANRNYDLPSLRDYGVGFRVVVLVA